LESLGYWRFNLAITLFKYISFASSLDHCVQKGGWDSSDTNTADSNHSYAAIEEVKEVTQGGITFNTLEHSQYFNFNKEDVTNYSINDECTI
jgi:hypothetical protein